MYPTTQASGGPYLAPKRPDAEYMALHSAPTPAMGEIGHQLESQEKVCALLSEAVERLEIALSAVLMMEPPPPVQSQTPDNPCLTRVGAAIHMNTIVVAALAERLNRIRERVAL